MEVTRMDTRSTGPEANAADVAIGSERPPSTLWERARHGWPATYPIAQFPNAPLVAAAGGRLVAAVTDGPVQEYGRAVFLGGLAVWAWLEVTDGANGLRRVLGTAALGYVVVEVARGGAA
jgi:hypothetical protein